MRLMRSLLICIVCAFCAGGQNLYASTTIRIATWNLNNLHYASGEPLRTNAPSRSDNDFDILARYAKALDADIIALQELNGPLAAQRVFPSGYDFYFSGRYVHDLAAQQPSDKIYTGFAVRQGIFDAVTKLDLRDLGVLSHDGYTVRWGVELLVEQRSQRLRLLNVHLKSGCARGNILKPRSGHCDTLARQRPVLEEWIDARAEESLPFVILGDFNRAFDVHGDRDYLWAEIDDGYPQGLDLSRLPEGRESQCWSGTTRHYPQPIDFLVFDQRAWSRVKPETLKQLTYASEDQDLKRGTPSDHCAQSVTYRLQ